MARDLPSPARRLRTALRLSAAVGLLVGAVACGRSDERAPGNSATSGEVARAPTTPPEREVITPEMEGKFAEVVLDRRDTPLAIGAKAPDVEGLPSKRTSVIVFFRGAW